MADNPGSIYESPAYLAFVRGGDFSLEEAARQTARKQQAINSSLALNIPDLERQGANAQKNIAESAETRGMARSGQRYLDQADAAATNQAQINRMQMNAADQIGSAHEDLASRVADVQMKAGELGYSTAQNLDYNAQLGNLAKKYATPTSNDVSDEDYGL